MLTHISVRGAREHNLKDIDVDIPRETLTVITGPFPYSPATGLPISARTVSA